MGGDGLELEEDNEDRERAGERKEPQRAREGERGVETPRRRDCLALSRR